MQDIFIKGAKTHNLKNIDVLIPRKKLVVVTGVSGSGKSSLTIDTLYAEGQRKYIESLSSYARQFLQRMNKPDVEYIKGLCPAIAIEQKVSGATSRSTVGTMTEMYDYLRLLYARAGETYSPISNTKVQKDEISDVKEYFRKQLEGQKFFIGYKLHIESTIEIALNILISKGFSRLYVDGQFLKVDDELTNTTITKDKNIYVVIQRVTMINNNDPSEEFYNTIADSTHTAFGENHQECIVYHLDSNDIKSFNHRFEADGMSFEQPTPQFFNFNNSYGACKTCEGMGNVLGIDEDLVIPDKTRTLFEEMVAPWKGPKMQEYRKAFISKAEKNGFPIHRPYYLLTDQEKQLLWEGNKSTKGIRDFFGMVEENLYKIEYRIMYSRFRGKTKCQDCHGSRIRKDAFYVLINNTPLPKLLQSSIWELDAFFKSISLTAEQQEITKRILLEINHRIGYMIDVGLGYLSLDRLANSLSGGEVQRINLTRTLGSNLTDSLYILDEPSVGLHPRDTNKLIAVLRKLRDLNNTVVIVEHEEDIIRSCDYIIDIGPKAGIHGGQIVYQGEFDQLIATEESLTTQYLTEKLKVTRRTENNVFRKFIEIKGASQHNLKDIDVKIPLEAIVGVSGVSGSGKTTLIKNILYPALMLKLGNPSDKPGLHSEITGDIQSIQQIELIDQNPLGRNSRSNPVTYVKAFDAIRDLFAGQPMAKTLLLQAKDFSFNVVGGRCETCKGEGVQVVSMQFLADVELTCEECRGFRYQSHVLDVTFREKSIYDILEMTIEDAVVFFQDQRNIIDRIKPLDEIGLGYVKLGQSSSTLSGGEAQRVKLASYLHKSASNTKTLFIFDEPTTGLHFYDVQKLLHAMERLILAGHSIIVIEHNMDILRNADYIIDLGPEGGSGGGQLLYQGPVSGIKQIKDSYTGQFI
jgi:excinuclease ABC subunit A